MSNAAELIAVRHTENQEPLPLLFQKREAVVLDPRLGSTTACQTTAANDYTPDD